MSEKLPRLNAKEADDIVQKLGFVFVRQSGSHKIYKNQKGQRITIPFHGSKILHPKLLKSIVKDANITIEELKKFI